MPEPDHELSAASRPVWQREQDMFEAASSLVGDRLGSWGDDPDGCVSFTIVDLTDVDVGHLQDAAVRVGLAGRVRLDRPDPARLEAWQHLRHDLDALADQRPPVLVVWPTTGATYHRAPVHIHLDASGPGVGAAQQLHDRYGDFVALRVGALRYPPDPEQSRAESLRAGRSWRDLVDPHEMIFSLDGPLSVRSGESAHHAVLLQNLSPRAITINTSGALDAVIVDPETGTVVGCAAGPHTLPGVDFTANPGETLRIPLFVGTASVVLDLGYLVPPGRWKLVAPLDLQDGRRLATSALELTIVD